jgi:hypothetical protein
MVSSTAIVPEYTMLTESFQVTSRNLSRLQVGTWSRKHRVENKLFLHCVCATIAKDVAKGLWILLLSLLLETLEKEVFGG